MKLRTVAVSGFTFEGYKYEPSVEDLGDNSKVSHDLVSPDGKLVSFDYSPYNTPTEQEIRLWILLGLPKRVGNGPLAIEDLTKLAADELAKELFAKEKKNETY